MVETGIDTNMALPPVIDSQMEYEQFARMLTLTHRVLAKLEERRKERTAPLYAAYKEEQELAKRLMAPYEKLKGKLANLLSSYLTWKFEGDQKRYLTEGSDAARRGAMQLWDPPRYADDNGMVFAQQDVSYEITCKELIPHEYLEPNDKAILQALEVGVQVPGVKITRTYKAVARQPTMRWQNDE